LLVIEQVLEASTAERKQVLPGKTSVSRMAASSEQEGIPMDNDNHEGLGSRIHALFRNPPTLTTGRTMTAADLTPP
jgi:hypothetical protein